MSRWGLKRSEAKQMIKGKRGVANPNSGFYTQLKIWGQCNYDIRSPIVVNGVKPFKDEYQVSLPIILFYVFETGNSSLIKVIHQLWLITFTMAKLEEDAVERQARHSDAQRQLREQGGAEPGSSA